MTAKKIKSIKAFSLIELLIVVSIFSILISITIPSIRNIINKNRALAHTSNIVTALQFSRTLAIKHRHPVTFGKLKDSNTWQDGQLIVIKDKIIRSLPAIPNGDLLIWHGSNGIQNSIVFLPDGSLNGQQGHFCYFTKNSPENSTIIVLNQIGRIRIENKTDDGKTITCNY